MEPARDKYVDTYDWFLGPLDANATPDDFLCTITESLGDPK